MTSDADREMHGGAGGGIGGPLPGEPKDPWEVRRQLVSAGVRIELPTGLREISHCLLRKHLYLNTKQTASLVPFRNNIHVFYVHVFI